MGGGANGVSGGETPLAVGDGESPIARWGEGGG